MDGENLSFIRVAAFKRLESLEDNTRAAWGVMSAQQMTEHLADFFDISAAKTETKLFTPAENLPKYLAFLWSEKLFRENTKAPPELLGDTPRPLRFSSLQEAKENLRQAADDFHAYFDNNENAKTLHPVFGPLNYDEWVRLHYKHLLHHLHQFGLTGE